MIATGDADPGATKEWERRISSGQTTLQLYIDDLVTRPGFAKVVAPRMILRAINQVNGQLQKLLRLKRSQVEGKTVFHLREACSPSEAVSVPAWWLDLTEVMVCPDSYQPTHVVAPGTDWECGSGNTTPDVSPNLTYCGCGRDLMYCYPDELYGAALSGMNKEVTDTIAYVVDKDLPIEQVFLQNETVRTGLADHHYEMWDVANKRKERPSPLAKESRLAPRSEYFPGMHAGILTTPNLLWTADAPRSRLNIYSYLLFCSPFKSARVDTSVLLGLGKTDIRDGEGWEKLVKLPGCNGCHAQLDYGVRFFSGWLDPRKSTVFHPEKQVSEPGRLYMRGYADLRETGTTTPKSFVELAVKQPEFASCQAQNVLDYVIGSDSTPTMRDEVVAASPKPNMRTMMRVVLRQYAASYMATAPRATTSPTFSSEASPPKTGDGQVVMSTELKAQLEEHCTDCHSADQDAIPNFEVDRLPQKLLQTAVSQVAFGAMPPNGLEPQARSTVLAAVVKHAWPASAAETFAFFENKMQALLVHHPESLINSIRARAGVEVKSQVHGADNRNYGFNSIPEIRLNQRYAQLTPSFTATLLLESLKACKLPGKDGAPRTPSAVKACMDAVSISSMIRSPR